MLYVDLLYGDGDVGGDVDGDGEGEDVVGDGDGDDVVGVGVGVGVGVLLRCGVGVGEGANAVDLLGAGDVAGALFAGDCTAARLLMALLVVADGAGLLVLEPAPDPALLCGFAPVGPAGWLGAGVPPALWIAPE